MDGSQKSLFILIVILIIDLLSFTCILPLFPSIIDYYAGLAAQIRENKNADVKVDTLYELFESLCKLLQSLMGVPDLGRYNNVFFGGILGSLFSFLQYISSPIFGALSDAYGRKPILIVSIVGSWFSYYLWSISNTFSLFILSRIVGGLSKASVSVAIAIVTDICPIQKRGHGMVFINII